MSAVEFVVYGIAQPAGSKKAFVNRRTGRAQIVDDAKKSRPWKHEVKAAAVDAMGDAPLLDGPLRLVATFWVPRPRGHYGAKGVRSSAPHYPAVRPDLTKLVRAVEDALTGIVWRDDAQVVLQGLSKLYGEPARVVIQIDQLPLGFPEAA